MNGMIGVLGWKKCLSKERKGNPICIGEAVNMSVEVWEILMGYDMEGE